MNKLIRDIKAFHDKFFPGVANVFAGPIDPDLMRMRLNFLHEELDELAHASGFRALTDGQYIVDPTLEPDLQDILDAIIDLIYVAMGTAHLCGLTGPTKVVINTSETPDELPKPSVVMCNILTEAWNRVQAANMAKIRATTDTKRGTTVDVIKPVNWRAPDFTDLLP